MLIATYAFDLRGHRRFYTFSYWGFFIALVLIAALRYRLGTDSVTYENGYIDFPSIWELEKFKFSAIRYEPGFLAFASIPRSISSDFTLFQFFHAFVVNLVIFWFIKSNSTHRFLYLTLYFIVMYFNLNMQVLRESLAVCCFLLAWPAFRDGKWLLYYLLTLLACTFHTSAFLLLMLPLFCLPGIKQFFVFGWRTLFISLFIVVVGLYIQSRFSAVFSAMAFTQRIMDRVNEYANNEFGSNKLNILGVIVVFLRICLYPLVALYFFNLRMKLRYGKKKLLELQEKKQKRRDERFVMMVLLCIYFSLFAVPMFIFGRYFNYFGLFALGAVASWAFSKLQVSGKTYRLKFATWIIILFPYIGLNLYSYNSAATKSGQLKDYMIYYPYNHRFDPERDSNREQIFRYWGVR